VVSGKLQFFSIEFLFKIPNSERRTYHLPFTVYHFKCLAGRAACVTAFAHNSRDVGIVRVCALLAAIIRVAGSGASANFALAFFFRIRH
jgi:hypothetical protein